MLYTLHPMQDRQRSQLAQISDPNVRPLWSRHTVSLRHLLPAAFLLLSTLAMAQTPGTGALSGAVRDEQGGAVGGAQVAVRCGAENRQTLAGANGQFSVAGLPAGRCSVTAVAPFFQSATTEADTSQSRTVSLVLPMSGFADTVQVTATRRLREDRRDIPQATSVTTREDLEARPYQLLPQVLREEPGILVQQTTSAQASPTIRGFTGSSNVYLLDGVRFNVASWRGGPSQYLAFVDTASVERLEVVRGPGSVQYGSDALGGIVNVLTARPDYAETGTKVGGTVAMGFGSAESSRDGQASLLVQGTGIAFRLGMSGRNVGDLRTGGGRDSHAAVTRFLGLPADTNGPRLPNTGYDQAGGFITGRIKVGATADIETLYMHQQQSGASRYDRVDGGNGLYRSGFDPQRLDFGLVRYAQRGALGLDSLAGTVSVNRQGDGQFEQTRPTAVLDRQQSVTTAIGYQLEGQRHLGHRQQFTFGAELYDETTTGAFREQINPVTGVVTPQRPDVPNQTTYLSNGVFAQDVVQVGRFNLRGGLRYGRYTFATVPDARFGIADEKVTTHALTFQAGAVARVTRHIDAIFSMSRGFRAPNAADLGSIGLSGGAGLGITPSRAAALGGLVGSTAGVDAVSTGAVVPGLGPETLYAFEPGIRINAGRVDAALTVFNMEYHDTVQRRAIVFPTNVVGQSIAGYEVVRQDATGLAFIAQDIRPVATSVNLDRSRVKGFEVEVRARLTSQWSGVAYYSMSDGRLLATNEPIRRMTPPMGGARLRWAHARVWAEGVLQFASAQTKLNAGDLTDARIGATRTRASIASYFNGTATDQGLVRGGILLSTGETLAQVQTRVLGTATSSLLFTEAPGYVVLSARAGVTLMKQLDVTIIGENLTDRNYRYYGSGVDAAGFNVQVRTRYSF